MIPRLLSTGAITLIHDAGSVGYLCWRKLPFARIWRTPGRLQLDHA